MSAPHIPNLLDSLRSARGARSARSRGGRGGGPSRSAVSHDATIQGTDTDAAVSRLSAVDLGYLDDPYAPFFVQSADGPAPRRLPIINRGTYVRTNALDTIVDAFLADGEDPGNGDREKQIVSLGAGTDTRPFRLFAQPARTGLVYHEIDFEVTSSKKFRTVQANPILRGILGDASRHENSFTWSSRPPKGGEYYCHGLDLRALSVAPATETETLTNPEAEAELAEEAPKEVIISGLRCDIPTLLISECCLCYLSPSDASGVLAYFTSRIPRLSTVIYEPIRPQDAFGRMMVSNLAQRHIRMPTLEVYHEPRDQEARLRAASFEQVEHMTIRGIWEKWVSADEKERVDSLEGLDEVEEWHLLADHYIVIWGSKGAMSGRWARIGQGISGTG